MTAVHGISDADVADAPRFGEIAHVVFQLLDGAVFVAHNARFDLGMVQHAFARAGVDFNPAGVACTLDAFRLLEPLAPDHRLESICERHGIALEGAHRTQRCACNRRASSAAPRSRYRAETVELDEGAFLRLRSRGDTRPASDGQIRRVFGLARSARILRPDRSVDRERVITLVERVAGTTNVDSLTREQVQDVYDELERLISALPDQRAA